jgi:hypothetical protein
MELIGWTRRMALPVFLTLLVLAFLAVDIASLVPPPSMPLRRQPPVIQPIAFNHKKHTQDLHLQCDFCHKYYKIGRHSGLPGAEVCGICHVVTLGKSPESAKVTELLKSGKPLQFKKLFRLPDYVYYSHRRHVEIAKLDCTNCHDGIADTEVPPQRPLIAIKMQFCLDCHKARGVTTDCTACHR